MLVNLLHGSESPLRSAVPVVAEIELLDFVTAKNKISSYKSIIHIKQNTQFKHRWIPHHSIFSNFWLHLFQVPKNIFRQIQLAIEEIFLTRQHHWIIYTYITLLNSRKNWLFERGGLKLNWVHVCPMKVSQRYVYSWVFFNETEFNLAMCNSEDYVVSSLEHHRLYFSSI